MICNFKNKYFFLSRLYPHKIVYGDVEYPAIENAFQATRARSDSDRPQFIKLSPGGAKRQERYVIPRPDWDTMQVKIMLDLLKLKFSDPNLLQMLLETGDEKIVAVNTTHDNRMGVCSCNTCKYLYDQHNIYGNLLMMIRDNAKKALAKAELSSKEANCG